MLPYTFIKRCGFERNKYVSHEKLHSDRFDIMLEVKLTAKTPVAHNPETTHYEKEDITKVLTEIRTRMTGIDICENHEIFKLPKKCWLKTDDLSPVISPMTMNGVLSSMYANIAGGCYRHETKVVKHRNIEAGKFPYDGRYKRFRVSRSNSKAGIIRWVAENADGSNIYEIEPVREVLCRNKEIENRDGFARLTEERGKLILKSFTDDCHEINVKYVKYFGPYSYGMNSAHSGKYAYRYYIATKESNIKIKIPAYCLLNEEELKGFVYIGNWYEDINTLKENDWVYYQLYSEETKNGVSDGAIGRCFNFKTVFDIKDAIPEEFRPCKNIYHLCPRCSLFGIASEGEKDNKYKGRLSVSAFIGNKTEYKNMLLPNQGEPKNSKKDVSNYYRNGYVAGAKVYVNSWTENQHAINREFFNNNSRLTENNTFLLKSFAESCAIDTEFTGMIKIENTNEYELIRILSCLYDSEFRIGLGKSFGLGILKSSIVKLHMRNSQEYKWVEKNITDQMIHEINKVQSNISIPVAYNATWPQANNNYWTSANE